MVVLDVVIVNFRTAGLVVDCLRSLAGERGGLDVRVVVVDNASGDGSVQALRSAIAGNDWAAWAEVLARDSNDGFAAGNNAVLRQCLAGPRRPAYVLLLNPDTVVRPGALRTLVDFLERHPGVGIAGSRLEDPDGTPQCAAFRFPGLLSELETTLRFGPATRLLRRHMIAPPPRDEAHATDWVAGASMLVRREVFEQVGLLDEGYFLYFEEVDFCLRAARAGWPTWHVPASRVVHLIGQSTGMTDHRRRRKKRIPLYWLQSRQRYFEKNHGRGVYVAASVVWSVGFALWRLRRFLQRKPDLDPPQLLSDFLRYNFLSRRKPTGVKGDG